MSRQLPGGNLKLAEDLTVSRVGFGAMQLAGPEVWGPPKDRNQAIAVLREAVELGITHIDTSDYYGPYVVNELIREALHPYPDQLHIATKVGARRDGTLTAIQMRIVSNTGAYGNHGGETLYAACGEAIAVYRCQIGRAHV